MNIFALSENPREAAEAHLDKHVVKMVIEYAQLLSTAHRLLDGSFEIHSTKNVKPKKFWLLPGEYVHEVSEVIEEEDENGEPFFKILHKLKIANPKCYNVTHANHPCAIWARETSANYRWLADLFHETATEYTHRYHKEHKTQREIGEFLRIPPAKIKEGDLTPFAQALPDEYKGNDAIQAYKLYYLGPKSKFATWTNRQTPTWFKTGTKDYDASLFERTTPVR